MQENSNYKNAHNLCVIAIVVCFLTAIVAGFLISDNISYRNMLDTSKSDLESRMTTVENDSQEAISAAEAATAEAYAAAKEAIAQVDAAKAELDALQEVISEINAGIAELQAVREENQEYDLKLYAFGEYLVENFGTKSEVPATSIAETEDAEPDAEVDMTESDGETALDEVIFQQKSALDLIVPHTSGNAKLLDFPTED